MSGCFHYFSLILQNDIRPNKVDEMTLKYKMVGYLCPVECSEKTKSFNLKIPQPDSERRHSPDFKTVFEIMIGPFSFCEIGKM